MSEKGKLEFMKELFEALGNVSPEELPDALLSAGGIGISVIASCKNQVRAARFNSEEDALEHAERLANMRPGSRVVTTNREGEAQDAVFVRFEADKAHLLRYDPGSNRLCSSELPIFCVQLPQRRRCDS